jgi:hypothetical protein
MIGVFEPLEGFSWFGQVRALELKAVMEIGNEVGGVEVAAEEKAES